MRVDYVDHVIIICGTSICMYKYLYELGEKGNKKK